MEGHHKMCACTHKSGRCDGNQEANQKDRKQAYYRILLGLIGVGSWYALYSQLEPLSVFLTYDLFGLSQGSRLGAAVQFFIYDIPKVMMLLVIVTYFIGVIRTFFTPERTRRILAGKRESVGNVLAAFLGVIAPFCSCSAVPLFIGFVTTGIPLGVTLSFLIAAPMVNEIALVLLYGLLGWKVAAFYMGTGLLIAIVAGWIIGKLGMESQIEEWVREMRSNAEEVPQENLSWSDRLTQGWISTKDIVKEVWIYVLAGIAVGAGIYGYVPEGFMASLMGKEAWWSVPAAVIIGIPMYSGAAGIIPVVYALLEKGAALGTVLAFMMSVIALSLPEMVILRKVLMPKLIGVFIGVVGIGILSVGYLFNIIL
jgi:uncharacterized membrane protein YraQ (UPF0718 family)